MGVLEGKHIAVGIAGGIAAYKSLSLIRLLKAAGADVRAAATPNALRFVTPLTIETLTQNRLFSDIFALEDFGGVQHILMAEWADCMVVAPATADIIGKYANGIADDALSTLLTAIWRPVFIAPSMNDRMLAGAAVQHNLQLLRQRGCRIIEPAAGPLACGSNGKGRLEEPELILQEICRYFSAGRFLEGKKVLVTAGPTHEPVDPVRFIGNHSSGRMGFALAEAAAAMGAEVTLVAGPVSLPTPPGNVRRVDVVTASEMHAACLQAADAQDLLIMAAAVADYRPEHVEIQKIKKSDDSMTLRMVKNPDILYDLGRQKRAGQTVVGFALETEHETDNAYKKMADKHADFMVVNSLRDEGAGFGTSTNKVTVLAPDLQPWHSELKDKKALASDILNYIHKNTSHE